MRSYAAIVASCALCMLLFGTSLSAYQLEERELTCPITGRKFKTTVLNMFSGIKYDGASAPQADMGVDEDFCGIFSGPSEYEYFVITSPWSFFTAMPEEWDKNGKYIGRLSDDVKTWAQKSDLNTPFKLAQMASYKRLEQRAARHGIRNIPAQGDWAIPQDEIPIEQRYQLALMCYDKRRFPPAFMAKLALSGAWAIRNQLNHPVRLDRIMGAYPEVRLKTSKYMKDNEPFDRNKWAKVYATLYKDSSLTEEAHFIVALTHVGFLLRQGPITEAGKVLDELYKLYDKVEAADKPDLGKIELRGFIRNRVAIIRSDNAPCYRGFLERAAEGFVAALGREDVTRRKMPDTILALAECKRRLGENVGAMDWYRCLAGMAETQPSLREEMRKTGGNPGPEAGITLQLGWIADRMLKRMEEEGAKNTGRIEGPEKALIDAILYQGLGTPEYSSPGWVPVTGASPKASEMILTEIGRSIIEYHQGIGVFPATIGDCWMEGIIRDRNRLNRFFCPTTGEKYLYAPPAKDRAFESTILLAVPKAIIFSKEEGERYLGFTYGSQVIHSKKPLVPGEMYKP